MLEVTAMDKRPEAEKKNGPLSILLMVVVGLFALAVFLGFFVLLFREGWSAATTKNPVGAAMFFMLLGLVYLGAIPVLRDKGHRTLANSMVWVALLVVAMFVASRLPSCSGSESQFPLDRAYRK
jgi:uncharacterized membrane protein